MVKRSYQVEHLVVELEEGHKVETWVERGRLSLLVAHEGFDRRRWVRLELDSDALRILREHLERLEEELLGEEVRAHYFTGLKPAADVVPGRRTA